MKPIPSPTRALHLGERMLSANQVCQMYGIDRNVVYEDIKIGRLPAINRSSGKHARWRVHPDAAFLAYGGGQ